MLTDLKSILAIAEKGNFAVPAFNVYNTETVMGIVRASEELRSPVIIQMYSRLFTSEEGYYVAPSILAAAQKATVPVCFHLDHGSDFHAVAKAVRYGCTGVMIDASSYPLKENVRITRKVVELCNPMGVFVEGELGHVGSAAEDTMGDFTKVDEALQFVQETGVSALAIMVGTAHGRYKKSPKLDIERISEIKNTVAIPLVLHGGSGIPDDQVKASIQAGIRKINFGTDVCYSFLDQVFASDRSKVAIDLFMKDAIGAVADFAKEKILLLGSDHKA